MFFQGIGVRRARFDIHPNLIQQLAERPVIALGPENLEALHERQAGIYHGGELPREDDQVFVRDFLLFFEGLTLLLLLDRSDRNSLSTQLTNGGIAIGSVKLPFGRLAVSSFSSIHKNWHAATSFHSRSKGDQSATEHASTSSIVVTPCAILLRPLWRIVFVPSSTEICLISSVEAPRRIASRIRGVMNITW